MAVLPGEPPADQAPPPDQAPRARVSYWRLPEPPPPPPGPLPGATYASVGLRAGAFLIDLLPLVLLGTLLFVPLMSHLFGAIAAAFDADPTLTDPTVIRAAIDAALAKDYPDFVWGFVQAPLLLNVFGLLYFGGSWLVLGRSPGMALLGLRIVREEDGARPGFGRLVVRLVGFVLGAAPLFLGYLWALSEPRHQAWHDKLAGTVVLTEARSSARTASSPDVGSVPSSGAGSSSGPARPGRRPSIGALAGRGWRVEVQEARRLALVLAPVLIVGLVVLAPLVGLVTSRQQVQLAASLTAAGAALGHGGSTSISQSLESGSLLSSAGPTARASAALLLVAGPTGMLLLALCVAATRPAGGLLSGTASPAADAWRAVLDRLAAVIGLGLVVGGTMALQQLLIVLPAASAAQDPAQSPAGAATASGLGALAGIVLWPVVIYLTMVCSLATIGLIRERLGVLAALDRARALMHGRLRWFGGLLIVLGLAANIVLGPIAELPVAVFGGAYLAGSPLVLAASGAITLLGGLILGPWAGLTIVAAYEVLRLDVPI